jgi:hypothetical protein
MQRGSTFVAVALAMAAVSGRLSAQSDSPVLLLQPGMATADFVSAEVPSSTGFNLRFAAIVPTRSRWWTLIVGASATPYGRSGTEGNANSPTLFIGNVFPVIGETGTGGWLSVDVPVLATYTRDGGSENNPRPYGRDVAVDLSLTAHVGRKLLQSFGGPLARLRAYGILEQNLTPNRSISGRRDRFSPLAFYGLTLAFGASRSSP